MSSVTNSTSGSHDSYGMLSCLRNREQNADWRQTHIYECQSSIIQNACLKTEFPRLKNIFDKAVWVDLFGQAALDAQGLVFDEEAPDMATRRHNMRVVDSYELEKVLATVGRAEDPGISELTLPRNFTLNKLIALITLRDRQVRFRYINVNYNLRKEIGDISITKTYRVAIANGILQGSRDMTYDAQEKLLKER